MSAAAITQANSQVSVNLSGANNAVDATALGIANTSVAGGGTELTGNTVNLNNTAATFLAGSNSSGIQLQYRYGYGQHGCRRHGYRRSAGTDRHERGQQPEHLAGAVRNQRLHRRTTAAFSSAAARRSP